jgi:hypothetical protein
MQQKDVPPSRFFFRPPQPADLFYVARWVASFAGRSEEWQHNFYKLLLEEFKVTADVKQQMSWMAIAGDQRLFFLEMSSEGYVYITAPAKFFNDPRLALAVWQKIVIHLHRQGAIFPIKVILYSSLPPSP